MREFVGSPPESQREKPVLVVIASNLNPEEGLGVRPKDPRYKTSSRTATAVRQNTVSANKQKEFRVKWSQRES